MGERRQPGAPRRSGAGIKVAQPPSDHRVEAVISGRFGLKAQHLEREGIAMWAAMPGAPQSQPSTLGKEGSSPRSAL